MTCGHLSWLPATLVILYPISLAQVDVSKEKIDLNARGVAAAGASSLPGGLILVLTTACLVLFANLGRFPLFNPDEALYAEPAREMLVTGEYITTLLNYVVRYTKPPLVIWAMALSYKTLGVSEFSARLFGAACGVALVGAVYLMISRYISTRAAVIGALSLVYAPLYVLTAREAITDIPLALFMAGAQMAFFHAFKSRRFIWAVIAYVLTGLAIMTKGPVGLVLPLAILFAYHFLRGELASAWRFYRPMAGLLIVGAISLPWFIVEINVTHGEYFREFILRENFQRFTDVVDNHKQPFWYHAAAMFGGYFPFSLYLPQVLWLQLSRLYNLLWANFARAGMAESWANNSPLALYDKFKKLLLNQAEREDLYFYCLIWAFAVLVFFSLSVSKLMPYTLPAFPAMAILTAGEIEGAFLASAFMRLCAPILAMVLIYAGAGMIAPPLLKKAHHVPEGLGEIIKGFAAAEAAVAVIALVIARLRRPVAAVTMLAVCGAAVFAVFLNLTLPRVSAKFEGQLPAYAALAGKSNLPIIVFDMRKPGVPFYALRQVLNINGGDELKQRLATIPQAYILSKVDKLDFLQAIPDMVLENKEGDFCMFKYSHSNLQ